MSAILEEGIGFGGNEESSLQQDNINLDPIIKELKKNKKTLIKETVDIPKNASTDDVVVAYSNHLNKKLAEKLLDMSNGKPTTLSEEEKHFLEVQSKKKSDFLDDVEIETPKEFVIKKGNKSLKINSNVLGNVIEKNYTT